MGATEIIPNDFWAEFHEDAEFEVKSAVASYFWPVSVNIFLVKILVKILCFFWVGGMSEATKSAAVGPQAY